MVFNKGKYDMPEKKMIKIQTGFELNLSEIFHDKNLDQACERLRQFTTDAVKQIEPLKGKAEEIVFDVHSGYEYDEVCISYRRLETDIEFQDRIARQEKNRLKKEKRDQEKLEKDRKLYEQLKQQFEKG
jgi:hypothetical protein